MEVPKSVAYPNPVGLPRTEYILISITLPKVIGKQRIKVTSPFVFNFKGKRNIFFSNIGGGGGGINLYCLFRMSHYS